MSDMQAFHNLPHQSWGQRVAENVRLRWAYLGRPEQFPEASRKKENLFQQQSSLPILSKTIGNDPVDLLGHSQFDLFRNGMNWSPRPIFQPYPATFESGTNLNAAYLTGPRAPKFLLASYGPIDGRLMSMEDPASWRAMMTHYRHEMVEGKYVLMRRRQEPRQPEAPQLMKRTSSGFLTYVGVPPQLGHGLRIKFDIRQNVGQASDGCL